MRELACDSQAQAEPRRDVATGVGKIDDIKVALRGASDRQLSVSPAAPVIGIEVEILEVGKVNYCHVRNGDLAIARHRVGDGRGRNRNILTDSGNSSGGLSSIR